MCCPQHCPASDCRCLPRLHDPASTTSLNPAPPHPACLLLLQWFLAVHAAIPFVAMLRKAVLMPKWAILLTLIGSSECPACKLLLQGAAARVAIALHCVVQLPKLLACMRMSVLCYPTCSLASHHWCCLFLQLPAVAGQSVGARMERQRMLQLSARRNPALTASAASPSASAGTIAAQPRNDCVMPGLEAGCRQCLKAAQSAISWTLAPVVVQ